MIKIISVKLATCEGVSGTTKQEANQVNDTRILLLDTWPLDSSFDSGEK